MNTLTTERREYQRIQLERPVGGRFGSNNVLILNLGICGALLEHHAPIAMSEKRRLVFSWEQHVMTLEAEVVRSGVVRFVGAAEDTRPAPVYNTGVRFLEAIGDSDHWLRAMIGFYVTRALEMQKANARGVPFDEAAFGDPALTRFIGARRDTQRGYMICRFNQSGWVKTSTTLKATQPPDGFTIPATETEADVELLCRTYEAAGPEGRRLIRMLAELSVSQIQQIPPRRYEP